MNLLLWISLPYATFGIVVENNRVINAAPIANWSIGKSLKVVENYIKKTKAECIKIKI